MIVKKKTGRLVDSCECCQSVGIEISVTGLETEQETYGFCGDCYAELKFQSWESDQTVSEYWETQ